MASDNFILRILREGNDETFAAAKDAIMQRVLQATVRETLEGLGSPDDIAEGAFGYVDQEHTTLRSTVNVVKKCLIEDVARRSTRELADIEALWQEARAHIDDIEPLVRGQEILTKQFLDEIADRSTEALADVEALWQEARACIEGQHTSFVRAADELKQQLIAEIARRSTDELSDPEAVACQAQALIGEEHEVILKAVDTLREQILQTIVRESLAKINDEIRDPSAEEGPPHPKPGRTPHVKTQMVGTPALPEQELVEREHGEEAAQTAYYIHGIVADRRLAMVDISAGADVDPEYAFYAIPYKSVAAIVSNLPKGVFNKKGEVWQDEVRCTRERILEYVNAAGYVVLPMCGDTTYPSKARLMASLAAHITPLEHALENLRGKQEWNVKVYCDLEKVRREIYSSGAAIDSFLGQFLSAADQWSTRGPKAELEALREGMDVPIVEVIDAILSNCEQRVHRSLCNISVDSCVVPPSEGSVFGSSRMVLNATYLVPEEDGKAFQSVLERLTADYDHIGLVYYLGGPHPPCRFVPPETPIL